MNREMKRMLKREEARNNNDKQKLQKVNEYVEEPCTYASSKPVYLGDVIKLKAYNEIKDIYDMQLEKLIMANHRFVIIHHLGIKGKTIAVCLLSTSSYLNERQELGIKLTGEYNKFKDVYMDATRCWVIPSYCAKSFEYKLNEDDKFRCILNWADNYAGNMKVLSGLYNNELVDSKLDEYKHYFNLHKREEVNNAVKMTHLAQYLSTLTEEELLAYLVRQPKSVIDENMTALVMHRQSLGMEVEQTPVLLGTTNPLMKITMTKEMLEFVVGRIMIDNDDYKKVTKNMARGY